MVINVTALMQVRERLGWSTKAIEFQGRTLLDFLKHVVTQDGASLHALFVQEDRQHQSGVCGLDELSSGQTGNQPGDTPSIR